MKRRSYTSSTLHRAAPATSVAIAVLLTLWITVRHDPANASLTRAMCLEEARHAAEYQIGRWIGHDVALPEPSSQILAQRVVLSRRYVNLDHGQVMDVLIMHCDNARDMLGHHPPICYPAHGWTQHKRPGTEQTNQVANLSWVMNHWPAQSYEFSRAVMGGQTAQIRIINFFILPEGVVTPDIRHVQRRANWLKTDRSGVTQVQVLIHDSTSSPCSIDGVKEILNGLSPLFAALGVIHHVQSQ